MTSAELAAAEHVAARLRAKGLPAPRDLIRDVRMTGIPMGGFRMDALSAIARESLNNGMMRKHSVY